jgi:hypothetical protein
VLRFLVSDLDLTGRGTTVQDLARETLLRVSPQIAIARSSNGVEVMEINTRSLVVEKRSRRITSRRARPRAIESRRSNRKWIGEWCDTATATTTSPLNQIFFFVEKKAINDQESRCRECIFVSGALPQSKTSFCSPLRTLSNDCFAVRHQHLLRTIL